MSEDVITEESKTEWLDEELKSIPETAGDFEKLPSPVFAENKITTMKLDATQQFRKWEDQENNKKKAIIPCTSIIDGKMQKCNWWLNLKNPVYREVIRECKNAPNKKEVFVRVMQTGSKQSTKYALVKE